MEITQDHIESVSKIIKDNVTGITSEGIWAKSTGFDIKLELFKVLHRMAQLGLTYKNSDYYFLVDMTPPAIDPEFKKPVAAKQEPGVNRVGPNLQQVTPVNVKSVSSIDAERKLPVAVSTGNVPKNGELFRSVTHGAAALLLYNLRNCDPIGLDEIFKYLKSSTKSTLSNCLGKLVQQEYIKRVPTSGRYYNYQWSFVYKYPFPNIKSSDVDMLNNDFMNRKTITEGDPEELPEQPSQLNTKPIAVVANNDEKINSALSVIDEQIAYHERQLSAMRVAKLAITSVIV